MEVQYGDVETGLLQDLQRHRPIGTINSELVWVLGVVRIDFVPRSETKPDAPVVSCRVGSEAFRFANGVEQNRQTSHTERAHPTAFRRAIDDDATRLKSATQRQLQLAFAGGFSISPVLSPFS